MSLTSPSIQPHTDLVDAGFDMSKAFNCLLYLEVDPYWLKFTVYDMKKSRYHLLKTFPLSGSTDGPITTLTHIYESEPLLRTDYRGIRVIFNNEKSVVVPKSLFDENELEAYFNIQHIQGPNEILLVDHLRN